MLAVLTNSLLRDATTPFSGVLLCLSADDPWESGRKLRGGALAMTVRESYGRDASEMGATARAGIADGQVPIILPDLSGSRSAGPIGFEAVESAFAGDPVEGTCIVLVAYEDLYAAATAGFRAACLAVARVEAVVAAPTVKLLHGAHDAVGSSALVRFRTRADTRASAAVAEMPDHVDPELFTEDFRALLRSRGAPTAYGAWASSVGSGREPWTLTFHAPKTTKLWRALRAASDVVPLGSVLDATDGPNDAVVTVIVGLDAPSLRVGVIGDTLAPGETSVFLKPVTDATAFEVRHAIRFLSSSTVSRQLSNLQAPDAIALVSHLALPMPAADLQMLITSLDRAVADMTRWGEEISSVGDLFFADSDFDAATRRVRSAGLRMSQRYTAAQSMESVGPRISATFPWPLALGWHEMERCGEGSLDRYVRALELSEAACAYVAVIAIMALRAAAVTLAATDDLAKRCASGHAITFSDWNEVLREACAGKVRGSLGASHPIPDLDRLFDADTFNDAVRRLVRKRNAQSHGKGPKDRELLDDIPAVEGDLRTLVNHLEFVATYDLVVVDEARTDVYTGSTEFVYRKLMGALPSGLRESGVTDDETPEAGSLHLVDRRGRFILLRPLLVYARCEPCHGDRTFVVDGAPDAGSLLFKGLAHSHEKSLTAQAPAFAALGWLT